MIPLPRTLVAAALAIGLLPAAAGAQAAKGKVLIVLSSENKLPLAGGKTYATGYYLNELIVPARRLAAAGYELVFTNPKGNRPAVDTLSESADYFGGSTAALLKAQQYRASLSGLSHPIRLDRVAKGNLSQYKAVFVPGGPAPMIDLIADKNLGTVLRYFHAHAIPTALLCHGPVALLSTSRAPIALRAALRAGTKPLPKEDVVSWPYKGYAVAVFSNEEESVVAKSVFLAEPLIYPQRALEAVGAIISPAQTWKPKIIHDRELITGQNPASDNALTDELLNTLSKQGQL